MRTINNNINKKNNSLFTSTQNFLFRLIDLETISQKYKIIIEQYGIVNHDMKSRNFLRENQEIIRVETVIY